MTKLAPTASGLLEQIDRLETQLITLQSLARFMCEVTGDGRDSRDGQDLCVKIEATAVCGTMGFFADEIESALGSLGPLRRFISGLPRASSA